MKGLKKVADESKLNMEFALMTGRKNMYMPIYYSSDKDTVYSTPGLNRELVTHLLNPCTQAEIKEMVIRWKWR